MAPIYDTDLASDRYSQSEWSHYELWEKVEVRLRRRRRLWIVATVAVFLMFSSVPILIERSPKWRSLAITRRLAQEVNSLKRQAILEHRAYRLVFKGAGSLEYRVEAAPSCSSGESQLMREGTLGAGTEAANYMLLSPGLGAGLGIPGLAESFCYDYLAGSEAILRNEPVMGFAVAPARDLTKEAESRGDRISVLVLSGPSADVSFE